MLSFPRVAVKDWDMRFAILSSRSSPLEDIRRSIAGLCLAILARVGEAYEGLEVAIDATRVLDGVCGSAGWEGTDRDGCEAILSFAHY